MTLKCFLFIFHFLIKSPHTNYSVISIIWNISLVGSIKVDIKMLWQSLNLIYHVGLFCSSADSKEQNKLKIIGSKFTNSLRLCDLWQQCLKHRLIWNKIDTECQRVRVGKHSLPLVTLSGVAFPCVTKTS